MPNLSSMVTLFHSPRPPLPHPRALSGNWSPAVCARLARQHVIDRIARTHHGRTNSRIWPQESTLRYPESACSCGLPRSPMTTYDPRMSFGSRGSLVQIQPSRWPRSLSRSQTPVTASLLGKQGSLTRTVRHTPVRRPITPRIVYPGPVTAAASKREGARAGPCGGPCLCRGARFRLPTPRTLCRRLSLLRQRPHLVIDLGRGRGVATCLRDCRPVPERGRGYA